MLASSSFYVYTEYMNKIPIHATVTPEAKQLAEKVAQQTTGGNVSVLIEMLVRKEARRLKVTLGDEKKGQGNE